MVRVLLVIVWDDGKFWNEELSASAVPVSSQVSNKLL